MYNGDMKKQSIVDKENEIKTTYKKLKIKNADSMPNKTEKIGLYDYEKRSYFDNKTKVLIGV